MQQGAVLLLQVLVVKVYLGASTESLAPVGGKKPELIYKEGKVQMSSLLEGPRVCADAHPGSDSVYRTKVSSGPDVAWHV